MRKWILVFFLWPGLWVIKWCYPSALGPLKAIWPYIHFLTRLWPTPTLHRPFERHLLKMSANSHLFENQDVCWLKMVISSWNMQQNALWSSHDHCVSLKNDWTVGKSLLSRKNAFAWSFCTFFDFDYLRMTSDSMQVYVDGEKIILVQSYFV